jgi:predicted nucleic acid-binding protein
MTVVSDSGPLIALARIGEMNLLPGVYGDIIIPTGCPGRSHWDGQRAKRAETLASAEWLHTVPVSNQMVAPVLDQLVRAGFRMGEDLYREILRLAGEL